MKFLILGGFLGSGKTTFLLNLAKRMAARPDIGTIAILENEVGKVGIDDAFLKSAGYQVSTLTAGCVCCTMAGSLPINVKTIEKDINPEWILMEASGMALPINVKDNLKDTISQDSHIICLADAVRFPRMARAMNDLLSHQFEGAELLVVNKIDRVSKEELAAVEDLVAGFCSDAEMVKVSSLEGISETTLDRIIDRFSIE